MKLCSLAIALLALAACKGGDGTPAKPSTRLVGDDAIATVVTELDGLLEANRNRVCERPLLRGQPAPGNADLDQLALDGKAPALARCRRALDDPAKTTDDTRACARAMVERLESAVSHADACAVDQPGRSDSERFRGFKPEIAAVERVAAERSAAGDHLGAGQLILDLVRYSADRFRGAGFVQAVGGLEASRWAVTALDRLGPALAPADLKTLSAEVDRLLATEPGLGAIIAADRVDMATELGLEVLRAHLRGPQPGTQFDEVDQAALPLIATLEDRRAVLEACPPAATWRRCHEKLEAIRATLDAALEPVQNLRVDDLGALADRAAARRSTIALFQSLNQAAFGPYLRRMGARRVQLVAMQASLALHSRARCPALGDLGTATETARASSGLGEPIPLVSAGPGRFALQLPPWLAALPSQRPTQPIEIACAAKK